MQYDKLMTAGLDSYIHNAWSLVNKSNKSNEIKGLRKYFFSVTIGKHGRPGTRRINTDVFLGINISSSWYSEIPKDNKTL